VKKSVTILALSLGLSFVTLNATNYHNRLDVNEVKLIKTEVSPLCTAVARGDIEKVEQLINNGVDVNQKSNGMLPIHYAAKFNRVEIIKLLITAGSEIYSFSDDGLTALRYAEKTNAKEALSFLKRFKDKRS
jgi:ankyrin repeat protein